MSSVSPASTAIVDSYLQGQQAMANIGIKVAAKTLDAARQEGQAVLGLLEAAAQVAKTGANGGVDITA